MSLGDPFGITAQLARKRTEDTQQGFQTLGQAGMAMGQGMQTQNMLKQFGIITEKEQPYSINEIKDFAKKKFGTDININSTMPEDKQVETAQRLLQSMGIQLPKRTIPDIDLDRAAKLGMTYKPDVFGGEATFAPKKPEPTIEETAIRYQKATELAKGMGEDTQASVSGKGQVSFKGATPQMKETESEANLILEGIKNGTTSPLLTGMGRTGLAGKVTAAASKEGFNLKQAQLDYLGTQTLTKTMNSNQQVNLRTALNSVKLDIEPMKELNNELSRTDINLANKIIVNAKLNGIDINTKGMSQNQLKVASKFITQLNLMRDNMAVAFMRGGVPTDQAFKLTDGILNPMYGGTRIDAALDQIDVNLSLRDKAISDLTPYSVGGTGAKDMGSQVVQQTGLGNGVTIGTIEDGYKFKGGNPADPKNWERQ